jgi:hypothetical protein
MTDGRQLTTVPVPGRGRLHHTLPSHNAHSRRRSAAACPDVKGPVSRRFRNTAGKASTLSRQNRKPPTAATPQPIDVSKPRLVDDAPLPCYQSRLKPSTVGRAVIPLVSVDLVGSLAPPPRWRADRRNILQGGREHGGVGHVGGGDHRGQRQPTAIADQVKLGPRLATIDGILRPLGPPPGLARRLMVSTLARDQSSPPCSPSRSNTFRWSASNTRPRPTRSGGASRSPASRSRVPGRAAAAKGWRCGPCTRSRRSSGDPTVRRRPPYGGRGGAGSNGSTSAHSSSGTRSSTRMVMARDPAIPAPRTKRTS